MITPVNGYNCCFLLAKWACKVLMVLSGMNSLGQLVENAVLMNNFKPLDAGEQEVIKKVTEIINRNIAIPCTACAYCVEHCPQHIAISERLKEVAGVFDITG
jgi:predicted aldo/keto reductase-like oxidoreductase